MTKHIKKIGLSLAVAAAAAGTAYPALANDEPTSICDREARTFNEWVIQIFTCR